MNTSWIATVYSFVILLLLTGCAASVQTTYSSGSSDYEGCEGSWDEIRKCAEEKRKERTEADSTKDQAEFAPDEMAVIVDSYWASLRYNRAGIWGVDGVTLNFKERVKIPPGKHTVTIYCAHGYGLGSQLAATIREVMFVAKSGHKYQAKCSEKDGAYRAWVQDTATDEVVGGPVW